MRRSSWPRAITGLAADSALDTACKRLVQAAFKVFTGIDQTVLVITHQRSTHGCVTGHPNRQ
jgi:ABC-type transport system involved in Fe-S cluster assembly fused permease/ATPase subunit